MCAAPAVSRLAAARAALAVATRAVGVPTPARAPDGHRKVFSTGVRALDEALGGGLPRGAIVDLTGPDSSGRLSWTLSLLSRALRAGETAALVDVPDALDPRAMHPSTRERLLWVRPRDPMVGLRCTDLLLQNGGMGLVALYLVTVPRVRNRSTVGTARQGVGAAAWTRLAQRAAQSNACLLVVRDATDAYAPGSSAQVTLSVHLDPTTWRGHDIPEAVHCDVAILRNRRNGTTTTGSVTFEFDP